MIWCSTQIDQQLAVPQKALVESLSPLVIPETLKSTALAISTGRWCSSIQVEIKAMVKALQILEATDNVNKARIVSDNLSVLLHIQSAHPSNPCQDNDERVILQIFSALSARSCQVTFTWCLSHCGIIGNELADIQARLGTDLDQHDGVHHYDTAKAEIRRRTRGGPALHKRTQQIYGDGGSKINCMAKRKVERSEQITLSRQ